MYMLYYIRLYSQFQAKRRLLCEVTELRDKLILFSRPKALYKRLKIRR